MPLLLDPKEFIPKTTNHQMNHGQIEEERKGSSKRDSQDKIIIRKRHESPPSGVKAVVTDNHIKAYQGITSKTKDGMDRIEKHEVIGRRRRQSQAGLDGVVKGNIILRKRRTVPTQPDTMESEIGETASAHPSNKGARLPSVGRAIVIEDDIMIRKRRSKPEEDASGESERTKTAPAHDVIIDEREDVRAIVMEDDISSRTRRQVGNDDSENQGDKSFVAKGNVIFRRKRSVPRQPDTMESEIGETASAHHSNKGARLPSVGRAIVIEDDIMIRKRRSKPLNRSKDASGESERAQTASATEVIIDKRENARPIVISQEASPS